MCTRNHKNEFWSWVYDHAPRDPFARTDCRGPCGSLTPSGLETCRPFAAGWLRCFRRAYEEATGRAIRGADLGDRLLGRLANLPAVIR